MMQFLEVNACAVIASVESLKGSGLKVVAYVNRLDAHGQFASKERIVIFAYNDAERLVLRNNAKAGDFVILRNAPVEFNVGSSNSEHKLHHRFRCNWYNEIAIIAGNNFHTLSGRKPQTIA